MRIATFALLATTSLVQASFADVITLGTAENSSRWLVTGGGAIDAPSFQTNVNRSGAISITSNAFRTGSFADGGGLNAFNGFWSAKTEFFIPGNASQIVLNFSDFYANDRGLLRLNGVEIGNVDHLGATGNGVFKRSQSGVDEPFTITGLKDGSVAAGFLLGEINVLEILVNNTGEIAISAPTRTFGSDIDATTAFLNASVTFTAVPEPTAGILLTTSVLILSAMHRRRYGRPWCQRPHSP